jgi:membrane-associated protein
VIAVLMVAALCGDNVNYFIGRKIGPRVFKREDSRWLKKKHLDRTHRFFERYGGKTIIIARFVPIVRTFAPFVAGVGQMSYLKFMKFCVAGAALWVFSLVWVGYWFGKRDFVKNNFSTVIVAIIAISILPAIIEFVRSRRHLKKETLPLGTPGSDASEK